MDSLKDPFEKQWDVETVRAIFNDRDAQLILKIPLPVHDSLGKVTWALEEDVVFSVKSSYRSLNGERAHENKVH